MQVQLQRPGFTPGDVSLNRLHADKDVDVGHSGLAELQEAPDSIPDMGFH